MSAHIENCLLHRDYRGEKLMAEKKNPELNPEEIECRVGAIMEQGDYSAPL